MNWLKVFQIWKKITGEDLLKEGKILIMGYQQEEARR